MVILERLSRTCGPFVLIDDADATPVVVTPGCDPKVLAAAYA